MPSCWRGGEQAPPNISSSSDGTWGRVRRYSRTATGKGDHRHGEQGRFGGAQRARDRLAGTVYLDALDYAQLRPGACAHALDCGRQGAPRLLQELARTVRCRGSNEPAYVIAHSKRCLRRWTDSGGGNSRAIIPNFTVTGVTPSCHRSQYDTSHDLFVANVMTRLWRSSLEAMAAVGTIVLATLIVHLVMSWWVSAGLH